MRSKWITHLGRQIFFTDYADQGIESLRVEMKAVDELICQQPEGSVLVLTDVRGMLATPEALESAKQSAARCKPYVRKQAVIGIAGARRFMLETIMQFSGQRNMMTFDDIEKAKDWLVE